MPTLTLPLPRVSPSPVHGGGQGRGLAERRSALALLCLSASPLRARARGDPAARPRRGAFRAGDAADAGDRRFHRASASRTKRATRSRPAFIGCRRPRSALFSTPRATRSGPIACRRLGGDRGGAADLRHRRSPSRRRAGRLYRRGAAGERARAWSSRRISPRPMPRCSPPSSPGRARSASSICGPRRPPGQLAARARLLAGRNRRDPAEGADRPGLALLTAGSLSIADRDIRWIKDCGRSPGCCLMALIAAPWLMAVESATEGHFISELGRARLPAKADRRTGIARRAARLLPGDGGGELLAGLAVPRSGADLGLAAAPLAGRDGFCLPGWFRPGSSSSSCRPSCRIMSCRSIRRWRCSSAGRRRKGSQNISGSRAISRSHRRCAVGSGHDRSRGCAVYVAALVRRLGFAGVTRRRPGDSRPGVAAFAWYSAADARRHSGRCARHRLRGARCARGRARPRCAWLSRSAAARSLVTHRVRVRPCCRSATADRVSSFYSARQPDW